MSVIVYYDGQCPLCSREIAHHREWSRGADVAYVDIAAPDFDAAAHALDAKRVRQVLHVRVGEEMRTGLDAVIAMWHAVATTRWLARVCSVPGIYRAAQLGYWIFARFRPYLQRGRRPACADGSCRVTP